MDSIRRDFRLTVDLQGGTFRPQRLEIVQLAPGSPLYYRDHDGALRPAAGEDLHSGDRYVITRVHPHLAAAKHEAAAELARRGEHLLALAVRCQQIEEVNDG